MIAVARATILGACYNIKTLETKTGKSMLVFSVRTWKPGKDGKDKVSFLPVVAYSGSADILGKHLFEGKLIYLDCDIDTYKDKEGKERFQFIVKEFSFLGDKKEVA